MAFPCPTNSVVQIPSMPRVKAVARHTIRHGHKPALDSAVKRVGRENLLAIREPEADNSKSGPNNRDSLFAATRTLRPQVLVKRKQDRRCLPRLVGMSVIGTKQTCTPSRRDV